MKADRILPTTAAVITIFNFLFGLLNSTTNALPFQNIIDLAEFSIPLRITITVLLELSLASFFGYIICLLILKLDGNPPSTILAVSAVSIVSAWVTFFNIEFVLLGSKALQGFWTFFGLFFLFLVAWAIGAIFINAHYKKLKCGNTQEFGDSDYPIAIQAFAFILIFIGAILQ